MTYIGILTEGLNVQREVFFILNEVTNFEPGRRIRSNAVVLGRHTSDDDGSHGLLREI
jgi:hypothetical protein